MSARGASLDQPLHRPNAVLRPGVAGWLDRLRAVGWPGWAPLLFIWLLPLHVLIITLLLDTGLPRAPLKALAAWKELTIVAVFATAAWRHGWRRPDRRRLRWPDWFALLFLAQASLYVVLPGFWQDKLNAPFVRLYSLRDLAFFLAVYLAARLTPTSRRLERLILGALVGVGLLAGVVGIVERFAVPLPTYVDLGVVRYHNVFLNLYYPVTWFNPEGLPENFFSSFGPRAVRRAVSIYLSAQPFALSYLLVLPATMLAAWLARGWRHRLLMGATALALVALDLTITRATIIACVVQLGVLGWYFTRRPVFSALLTGGVAVAMVLGITLAAGWLQTLLPQLHSLSALLQDPTLGERADELARRGEGMSPEEAAEALRQFTTGKDPSAAGHGVAWASSLEALKASPIFGHGLGTAGQTALRLERDHGTGGESLYFKFTGEMGLLGLGAYLGVFLGVLWLALGQVRRADTRAAAAFPLLVLVAGLGIAISGISTPLYDVPFMTYVFWYLAGLAVNRDARPAPAEAAP